MEHMNFKSVKFLTAAILVRVGNSLIRLQNAMFGIDYMKKQFLGLVRCRSAAMPNSPTVT